MVCQTRAVIKSLAIVLTTRLTGNRFFPDYRPCRSRLDLRRRKFNAKPCAVPFAQLWTTKHPPEAHRHRRIQHGPGASPHNESHTRRRRHACGSWPRYVPIVEDGRGKTLRDVTELGTCELTSDTLGIPMPHITLVHCDTSRFWSWVGCAFSLHVYLLSSFEKKCTSTRLNTVL